MADNSKVPEDNVSQVTRNIKLVRLRTWLALQQKHMALLLGADNAQLSRWGKGLAVPDDAIQKASSVFEVPIEWFDDGIDSPPPVPLTRGTELLAKAILLESQKATKVQSRDGRTVSIEVPGYKIQVIITPTDQTDGE